MLLIVEPPGQRQQRSESEGRQVYEQMRRFADGLESHGKLIACESLASDKEGTRVQVREGRQRLVDGPFAEAKEMVGGFFLIDCETREEALAIAAECPAAQWCTVEVRRAAPCYE
jgi:hypothetical protein